jgi:hypothetical protein
MGEGDAPTRELSAAPPPTRELPAVPAAGSGDRCSNCGSSLAHDQRYCVQCGERRGQSTFPRSQPSTEVRSTRTRSVRAARPPRLSSGATLVSFVGVLLLAVGLGVLIGHLGKNTPAKASTSPPVTILQQGGGGGAAAATTATNTASTPTATTPHTSKKVQAKEKAAAASKTVQKKAVQAASKVLGNSNNLPPPTVKPGGSCSNSQAGCQGGHFTGNFFGGG